MASLLFKHNIWDTKSPSQWALFSHLCNFGVPCFWLYSCSLKKKFIYLFIHSLLHIGFLWSWPARATLCCSVQASHCSGFWLLLWSTGSRAWAQQLWHTGLVALWHEGSFRTRDWTHVPCIGRQTPKHWTTREVPTLVLGTIPHLTHSVFSLVISSAKVSSMNTRYFVFIVVSLDWNPIWHTLDAQ